ncbi:MAG: HEAT repeat domain-containing protein, partial [bacterium]
IRRLLMELVNIGKAGVPTLIKVIKDRRKNWQFRALIIYVIVEEIKDDRIIEHLIEIVNDEKEDIVVRNEIVGLLNEKFGKNFPNIKISDKEKGKIEKEVKKAINSIDKKCKLMMKNDIDDVLVSLIIDGEIGRLIRIGKPGIPFMIGVIKDKKKHWYCRIRVFITGCIIGDKRVIKPLMEILEDKSDDSRVRSEAAYRLAKNNLVGAEYLLGILKDESDTCVRIEILRGLGTCLRDKKAIDALVEALDDENEIVAAISVDGLGFIGGEKVVEPLINALKNNRHTLVRARAAEALGRTKSKRAIEPLIENLKKGDMWAADALGELGKEMKGNDRDRIVKALIEGLEIYKINLDSLSWDIAAKALGKIGDKRAVEPLIEALWATKGSSDSWLIINALGEIGDKRAIEPLEKALQDERYKNAIINILGALSQLTGEDYKSLKAKYKVLRR